MKKLLIAAMVGAMLLGTASQPAEAFFFHHKHFFFKKFHHFKKPPKVKVGARLGSTSQGWVPQYVFAATTCSALVLWFQALHTGRTQHRELTQKEAWTTIGNCFLPFIGGEIMGRLAQQP